MKPWKEFIEESRMPIKKGSVQWIKNAPEYVLMDHQPILVPLTPRIQKYLAGPLDYDRNDPELREIRAYAKSRYIPFSEYHDPDEIESVAADVEEEIYRHNQRVLAEMGYS